MADMKTSTGRSFERGSSSLPVAVLTFLGALIALLGVFAAGSMLMAGLGLAALVAAGLIGVAERLVDARVARQEDR